MPETPLVKLKSYSINLSPEDKAISLPLMQEMGLDKQIIISSDGDSSSTITAVFATPKGDVTLSSGAMPPMQLFQCF